MEPLRERPSGHRRSTNATPPMSRRQTLTAPTIARSRPRRSIPGRNPAARRMRTCRPLMISPSIEPCGYRAFNDKFGPERRPQSHTPALGKRSFLFWKSGIVDQMRTSVMRSCPASKETERGRQQSLQHYPIQHGVFPTAFEQYPDVSAPFLKPAR